MGERKGCVASLEDIVISEKILSGKKIMRCVKCYKLLPRNPNHLRIVSGFYKQGLCEKCSYESFRVRR